MYADTIYETPDEWGNVTKYADEDTMSKLVASLRTLGPDWANCAVSDCDELALAFEISGAAVYRRLHTRREIYMVFVPAEKGGYYTWTGQQYDSLAEAHAAAEGSSRPSPPDSSTGGKTMPDKDMLDRNLQNVQVGDTLLIMGGGALRLDTVAKLTPTQVVMTTATTRFSRADGREVGAGDIWHLSYAYVYNAAARQHWRTALINRAMQELGEELDKCGWRTAPAMLNLVSLLQAQGHAPEALLKAAARLRLRMQEDIQARIQEDANEQTA